MRFVLVLRCTLAAFCGDKAFNGRWNMKASKEPRNRAWWLEVTGAGTPKLKGRFAGAHGCDMNDIPEMSIAKVELNFGRLTASSARVA